ncbi:uncharacterized protein F5147DRAFT_783100 [Suillus discolor]|uniref:Uncharacterized protein n=1 Tax=Suillus discolor TaxID=1912936 RepID=A0A9P7EQA7_9AGAM|nr:uncharacterized protein F5147DRAFT_783100 [Suillus discolor]KAG2082965.1 hypothetical protein F5147DRAFT_783100 [Suillus discolor]
MSLHYVSILGANPALSLKTISSRPEIDHAANYFQISRTAGSTYLQSLHSGSAQYGGHTTDTHAPPHTAPPHTTYEGAGYSAGAVYEGAGYSASAAPHHAAPPHAAPPHAAPSHAALPHAAPPHIAPPHIATPYASPPSRCYIRSWGDGSNVIILDSPPRPQASTKRPLPASPPSPLPRSEFALSEKMQTYRYNSCASFGAPSRGDSKAVSSPVSTTPTSEPIPSLSKGKGRQVKKQCSDLQSQAQSQMEALNDRIEKELKNERYMAKYNLAHQTEEHQFLHEERSYQRTEAAVIHQRAQEAKDAEIRLCEAEMRMHDALTHVHAEEGLEGLDAVWYLYL